MSFELTNHQSSGLTHSEAHSKALSAYHERGGEKWWSVGVDRILKTHKKDLIKFAESCSAKNVKVDERKQEMQKMILRLGEDLLKELYPNFNQSTSA